MSNQQSENLHPLTPDSAAANLRIEHLSEETHELNDEQSKAIAGGRSVFDLDDEQLESVVRNIAIGGIRIIGF